MLMYLVIPGCSIIVIDTIGMNASNSGRTRQSYSQLTYASITKQVSNGTSLQRTWIWDGSGPDFRALDPSFVIVISPFYFHKKGSHWSLFVLCYICLLFWQMGMFKNTSLLLELELREDYWAILHQYFAWHALHAKARSIMSLVCIFFDQYSVLVWMQYNQTLWCICLEIRLEQGRFTIWSFSQ